MDEKMHCVFCLVLCNKFTNNNVSIISKLPIRWETEINATSLSWSNCRRTGAIVPIAWPIRAIALSVFIFLWLL